jgi:putative restriction endonuclease
VVRRTSILTIGTTLEQLSRTLGTISVKIYVANTDPTWYQFLAQHEETAEVNFWRPRGSKNAFRAIAPNEFFFFRLGRPFHKIVGFGVFTHHSVLPLSLAWDAFGQANGCATLAGLISLIARHRGENPDVRAALNWQIGCTILTNVHYYSEEDWLDFYFAPGIMQGKSLDVSGSEEGRRIWMHMQSHLDKQSLAAEAEIGAPGTFNLVKETHAAYAPTLARQRGGQGTFRVMVLDAYNRRCCVTGERTLPVIEAAHIQPYVSPASNHVQNGLALREDVHTLFDRGYVTVDESHRFVVSRRLREDYENGREYYRYHGRSILLPASRSLAPSEDAIRWHQENVYIG